MNTKQTEVDMTSQAIQISVMKAGIMQEAHGLILQGIREQLRLRGTENEIVALCRQLIVNQDNVDIEMARVKDLKKSREVAAKESAQGVFEFDLDEYMLVLLDDIN